MTFYSIYQAESLQTGSNFDISFDQNFILLSRDNRGGGSLNTTRLYFVLLDGYKLHLTIVNIGRIIDGIQLYFLRGSSPHFVSF